MTGIPAASRGGALPGGASGEWNHARLIQISMALLTLVYLAPIWLYPFFPTQDGPSHLYNAFVLRSYGDPAYPFQEFYSLRLSLFPNWLFHGTAAALMLVVSPLVAEKILLSLYVVSFPLAATYFVRAFRPGWSCLPLISFMFIYNYLLFMGFYNFVFSLPMLLVTLGFWWKNDSGHRLTYAAGGVVAVLVLVLYFCHLMSFAISVALMVLLFLFQRRPQCLRDALPLLVLLPGVLLCAQYVSNSTIGQGAAGVLGGLADTGADQVRVLTGDMVRLAVLDNFGGLQAFAARGTAVFMALLVLLSGVARWRQNSDGRICAAGDVFAFASLGLLVLYLMVPFSSGFYAWLNDRLLITACLLLLPFMGGCLSREQASFSPVFVDRLNVAAGVLLGVLALVNLVAVTQGIARTMPVLEEYVRVTEQMAPRKVVLPLVFGNKSSGSQRAEFLTHASSYVTLRSGGINLDNYEVQFEYFPVTFKEGLSFGALYDPGWISYVESEPDKLRLCAYGGYVDYLLVWGTPDPLTAGQISACYRQVGGSGRHTVYQPAQQGPGSFDGISR